MRVRISQLLWMTEPTSTGGSYRMIQAGPFIVSSCRLKKGDARPPSVGAGVGLSRTAESIMLRRLAERCQEIAGPGSGYRLVSSRGSN